MSNLPDRFKGREEKTRLRELVSIVHGRLGTIQEAADALREINETKLYRLECKTFDEFCQKNFGFGKTTGYKLITSKKITDNEGSSMSASRTSPDNSGSKLDEVSEPETEQPPPPETNGAGREPQPEPEPEEQHIPVVDAEGHEVPKEIEPAFLQVAAFKELDSLCQKLQKGIDDLSRGHAGFQLRRQLQSTGTEEKRINKSEHLNKLKSDLKFTRPHSVCPYCAGKSFKEVEDCKGCGGAGWVTVITYKSVPDELKAKMACSVQE